MKYDQPGRGVYYTIWKIGHEMGLVDKINWPRWGTVFLPSISIILTTPTMPQSKLSRIFKWRSYTDMVQAYVRNVKILRHASDFA